MFTASVDNKCIIYRHFEKDCCWCLHVHKKYKKILSMRRGWKSASYEGYGTNKISSKYSFLLLIEEASGLSPPHLRGPAGGICTHGAGHQHLRVDSLSLLQVVGHQVCHALDEDRICVGRRASCDPLCPDLGAELFRVLDVQLVQSLDVVVHKSNWHQHEILLTAFHKSLYRLLSAGLQPR